jgi:hypothetical protein
MTWTIDHAPGDVASPGTLVISSNVESHKPTDHAIRGWFFEPERHLVMTSRYVEKRSPLSESEIQEWFDVHLPYRVSILLAWNWRTLSKQPRDIRAALFEASLMHCRTLLDFMGIGLNKGEICKRHDYKVELNGDVHDLKVKDLGGSFIELSGLSSIELQICESVIRGAHKASAHLTHESQHGFKPEALELTSLLVAAYLHEHLYCPRGLVLPFPPGFPDEYKEQILGSRPALLARYLKDG